MNCPQEYLDYWPQSPELNWNLALLEKMSADSGLTLNWHGDHEARIVVPHTPYMVLDGYDKEVACGAVALPFSHVFPELMPWTDAECAAIARSLPLMTENIDLRHDLACCAQIKGARFPLPASLDEYIESFPTHKQRYNHRYLLRRYEASHAFEFERPPRARWEELLSVYAAYMTGKYWNDFVEKDLQRDSWMVAMKACFDLEEGVWISCYDRSTAELVAINFAFPGEKRTLRDIVCVREQSLKNIPSVLILKNIERAIASGYAYYDLSGDLDTCPYKRHFCPVTLPIYAMAAVFTSTFPAEYIQGCTRPIFIDGVLELQAEAALAAV